MITCTLAGKKYSVDFVTGRALRECGEATKTYAKIIEVSRAAAEGRTVTDEDAGMTLEQAMDAMVRWFCILFQNQFSPDDVYDGYPADRIIPDIATALLAVQAQTTEVLNEFPMKAAPAKKQTTAEKPTKKKV